MPRYSNPASQKLPALCAHARRHLAPGGNGYIEESPMPYLYRQAPLNAIWEGPGNAICLDVLRNAQSDPGCVALLEHEIAKGILSRTYSPDHCFTLRRVWCECAYQ